MAATRVPLRVAMARAATVSRPPSAIKDEDYVPPLIKTHHHVRVDSPYTELTVLPSGSGWTAAAHLSLVGKFHRSCREVRPPPWEVHPTARGELPR